MFVLLKSPPFREWNSAAAYCCANQPQAATPAVMKAVETASATDGNRNHPDRKREKSLSRITWIAAVALAASPHRSNANVTEPIVQRTASGGHSGGAGQSPVTSQGVATQWRPVTIVPAASQTKTMNAEAKGTAIWPSVRQRRALKA